MDAIRAAPWSEHAVLTRPIRRLEHFTFLKFIGDEGASTLADALMATLTLCANCSYGPGEGTVACDSVVHDMISSWRNARRERAVFGVELGS